MTLQSLDPSVQAPPDSQRDFGVLLSVLEGLGLGEALEPLLERLRRGCALRGLEWCPEAGVGGAARLGECLPPEQGGHLVTLEHAGERLGVLLGWSEAGVPLPTLGPEVCVLLGEVVQAQGSRSALERADQNLAHLREQLEALHTLALAVSLEKVPQAVIVRSLELCCSVLGAEMAGYWRAEPDPDGGPGHWVLELVTGSASVPLGLRVRRDTPVVQNQVVQGHSVNIEDYQSYAHRNPQVARMGWRSLLFVPIGRGEQMSGVFTLADNRRTGAFSASDQALLERFAALTHVALEGARLLESTSGAEQLALRQVAQLEALHLLEVEVASQRDPRRVVEKALELSCALFGVDSGGYWRLFRTAGQVSHIELRLKHGGVLDPIGTRMEPGEGAVSEVVEQGLPLLIPDYTCYPRRSTRILTPYRSMLLVPLRFGEELLGVLSVADPEPGVFSVDDLELFGRFGRLVGVALFSARLLEQTQEAERRARRRIELLETLSEMSRELSQELEPERLYQSLLGRAARLFGAQQGGLYLPDASRQTLHLVSNLGIFHLPTLRVGEGLVGQVAAQGVAQVLTDYQEWSGRLSRGRAKLIRSAMAVPLGTAEQVGGVLVLVDLERAGVFGAEELEMLSRLTSLATVALENAQLYQIARRSARFERLRSHLASTVASSGSPREFCERLLLEVASAFGFTHLFIAVVEGDSLHIHAGLGYLAALSGQRIHDGVSGRVARTGQSAWVQDASLDSDWVSLNPQLDQMICVPLRGRGVVRGVIGVEAEPGSPLTHTDFEHLEAIAESVGVALENLLLMEALEKRSRELEKLSREAEYAATHDSLTKLPNRRAFERDARAAIRAADEEGTPFTLLAIDLSGFKAVNDRIGHAAGDHALQRIAHVLASVCPKAYRTGGDEFLLLLDMKMGRSSEVADYIVERLKSLEFDRGLRIFPNIGLAEYPREAAALDPLQTLADARMYTAKRLGKPRLTQHELDHPPTPRRRASDLESVPLEPGPEDDD